MKKKLLCLLLAAMLLMALLPATAFAGSANPTLNFDGDFTPGVYRLYYWDQGARAYKDYAEQTDKWSIDGSTLILKDGFSYTVEDTSDPAMYFVR